MGCREEVKAQSQRAQREDAEIADKTPALPELLFVRGTSVGVGLLLVVVYHSCDPVSEDGDVKVDQQSDRCFEQAHVGEKLCVIHRVQDFLALEFYNHLTLDEHVSAKPAFQFYISIHQRHWFLVLDVKPQLHQFVTNARLVSGFQKSRTQRSVDFDTRADDLSGSLVDFRRRDEAMPNSGRTLQHD